MTSTLANDWFSRVLIFEDDRGQLQNLTDIFTGAGFTSVPCPDLAALGRQLVEGQFGSAIVDLKLAGVSGTDAFNLIRQTNPAARIIIYTADGTYESAKEAVNLGAFAYVEKGGDINELLGHVRRAANELLVEALERSEQTFRKLAENIHAVFWMRSAEGQLVYMSPKCEQIWGVDSASLRSNPHVMIESIVEEDRPRVSHALAQLCSDTKPVNFDLDYRIQRLDGEIVWIRDRSFSIHDDQGKLIRHAGLVEDITQARLDMEHLRVLERAIACADIGIVVSDARQNGNVIYCNEAFERQTGYSVDEMFGRNCRILQAKDRDQDGTRELRSAVADGRETAVILRNYRKDGSFFWNEVSISPVYDALGELTHFVGFQRDVTSRIEMEQKLRESEQRFRIIFEQAAVGVALIESNTGRFLRINKKYSAMIGYSVDEILTKTFLEVTFPADLQEDLQNMEKLKAGEISEFNMEKRLICKNGSVMWVKLTVSPTWQPGESQSMHVAIVEDITKRKHMEQTLLENERSLAKAQSIARIGNWEFDLSSGQLSGSAEMLRIMGLSETDLMPGFESFIGDFVDPRDRNLVSNSYLKALETGEPVPIEFRFCKAPDKETRYGHCETEIVKDETGVPQKIIGTLQDVTEQKLAAEERTRHLEELAHVSRLSTMGEMVAGIAHELNQPLYSIANYSEACTNTLLKSQDQQIDRVLKWTSEISKQATRAGLIIQRLGEFVRKEKPHRSTIDINSLLRDSAELLSFETRQHQIRVEFLLEEPPPHVLADRVQLQQVIVNLFRNACETVLINDPANRQVIFTTARVGGKVMVRIEDNGPGISPDAIEKIFEPFYTTKRKGMGMGLAISKSILETHNSELTVWSGETGTTFEFLLKEQAGGNLT